jgi:purine-binding chemotaxis protein CheW
VSEPHPEPGSDAIVVRLGTNRFAVDLGAVAEVGRIPAITRVPGVPEWLAGVTNWRGRVMAMLDLRRQLGADAVAPDDRGRVLVLSAGGVSAGLLVDAVDGTTTLDNVAAIPLGAGATESLLAGQAPREDGPLAVIDVDAVMRLRQRLPRGRRTA